MSGAHTSTELTTGLLLAAAGAIALSVKAIFVKLAYQHGVTPFTLTGLRMGLALPIFFGIALVAARKAAPVSLSAREKSRSCFSAASATMLRAIWISKACNISWLASSA